MPGSKRNLKYDEYMNQLLGKTSDRLADIFASEYKFASAPGAMEIYVVEGEELFVTIRPDRRAQKVDKFNWLCSCEYSSTMQLPCRHSMLNRKNVWRLFKIPYSSISRAVKQLKQITDLEKFKSAQDVFNRISIEISDLRTRKFQAAITHLEKRCQYLRQGDATMPYRTPTVEPGIKVPPAQESKATSVAGKDTEKAGASEESDIGDEDAEEEVVAKPEVSPFNLRAKRVGRLKKNKKTRNPEKKLRQEGVSRCEVEKRSSSTPPLVELSSFLSTFEIRYIRHRVKKMDVTKRLPDSSCKPFRLSESLVRTALDTIEKVIPSHETMGLRSCQSATEVCWVINIDGVGVFTHTYKSWRCSLCGVCRIFAPTEGTVTPDAAEIAGKILSSWPCARVERFASDFTLEWTHVYCVRLIQRQRDRCLYQKVSHQILEQHYDHSTSAEDTGLDERQTHFTADAELRGRSNRTVCVHAVEHQLQALDMPRTGFLEKDYLLLRQHGYAVTPQHVGRTS
ncbi:hypothetical protein GQ600_27593 [Phytophthora cactorum]|nr:hypothetical protein GQ600_27593 [Phytophthora cactorum]